MQPDLFTPAAAPTVEHVTEADQSNFRAHLMSHGWQTRKECCAALAWDERKLRAVAQSLGGQVIRCQLGYKLTDSCDRNDLPHMTQAADAAGSQAGIMRTYELAIRRAIHAIIG